MKKIADLAETYYIPVATHNVAGPIATTASANLAASVHEFVAHEVFVANPINRPRAHSECWACSSLLLARGLIDGDFFRPTKSAS